MTRRCGPQETSAGIAPHGSPGLVLCASVLCDGVCPSLPSAMTCAACSQWGSRGCLSALHTCGCTEDQRVTELCMCSTCQGLGKHRQNPTNSVVSSPPPGNRIPSSQGHSEVSWVFSVDALSFSHIGRRFQRFAWQNPHRLLAECRQRFRRLCGSQDAHAPSRRPCARQRPCSFCPFPSVFAGSKTLGPRMAVENRAPGARPVAVCFARPVLSTHDSDRSRFLPRC